MVLIGFTVIPDFQTVDLKGLKGPQREPAGKTEQNNGAGGHSCGEMYWLKMITASSEGSAKSRDKSELDDWEGKNEQNKKNGSIV